MTDETVTPDAKPEPNGNDTAVTPAEAQTTDTAPAEHMIPKSRFDEVNNQLKELKAAQETATQAQEAAKRERLEKQQEFEKLYNETKSQVETLTPYKLQVEGILNQTKERNAERVKAVPKEMQALVPEYDDPLKLATWLDANESVLSKKQAAPSLDGGVGRTSQNGNAPTPDEIRERAARLNVSAKHLAEQYGVTLPK